jgi:hypothetical protein
MSEASLYVAYGALVVLAVVPIYVGSWLALTRAHSRSPSDPKVPSPAPCPCP